MNLSKALFVLSGLIFVYAFYPYLKAVVKKEARPRKATWFIWAIGDVIVLAGMLAKHTYNGIIIVGVLGATATFILSLIYGESGWTKRDKVCITLSMLAIVLWIHFGESNWGIAFSIASLAIAAWPTYVSAYENPENEDAKGWIWFNLSSFVGVLAIPSKAFADIAPAVAFMAIDGPMIFLVVIPWTLKRKIANV